MVPFNHMHPCRSQPSLHPSAPAATLPPPSCCDVLRSLCPSHCPSNHQHAPVLPCTATPAEVQGAEAHRQGGAGRVCGAHRGSEGGAGGWLLLGSPTLPAQLISQPLLHSSNMLCSMACTHTCRSMRRRRTCSCEWRWGCWGLAWLRAQATRAGCSGRSAVRGRAVCCASAAALVMQSYKQICSHTSPNL